MQLSTRERGINSTGGIVVVLGEEEVNVKPGRLDLAIEVRECNALKDLTQKATKKTPVSGHC